MPEWLVVALVLAIVTVVLGYAGLGVFAFIVGALCVLIIVLGIAGKMNRGSRM